jgi:hypothetical protein
MYEAYSVVDRRHLLVTGAHRSGTTWVGKMLAMGGAYAYVSEPLNVYHRPGVMRVSVPYWYFYIYKGNEGKYLPALRETVQLKYHVRSEIKSLQSAKDFLRMVRDLSIFTGGRLTGKSTLLKDPFAIFSAPWFAERLDCQVVLTVRHPAAFVSSLKRLNWYFPFKDLLSQSYLMSTLLAPFHDRVEAYVKTDKQDMISSASLLWCLVYEVVYKYQQEFPAFEVVRHEDLSLSPLEEFQALYKRLGLDFNQKVRNGILKATSSDNPSELSKRSVHSVRLDSHANLENWKKRLTAEEIQQVRTLTEHTAGYYYHEKDWY